MTNKTLVRFNLIIKSSSKDEDELIGFFSLPAIPGVGELINIEGEPYYVNERSWAISKETNELFSFIRVLKAGK